MSREELAALAGEATTIQGPDAHKTLRTGHQVDVEPGRASNTARHLSPSRLAARAVGRHDCSYSDGVTDREPAEVSFGTVLRRARTTRGLSLAGLARLVHYSRGYLSKVETGASKPNPALARRCDEALGMGGELSRLLPPRRRALTPVPARPKATQRPFDLPSAPEHLIGRAAESAAVVALLRFSRAKAEPGAVRQVVVHGMAGVGKTALAVHAAHLTANDFPDGCLFLDFRSYGLDGVALTAGDALELALRRLGVAAEAIPARTVDRAALYRGTVHGLRLLVIVDDADGLTRSGR